MVFKRRDKLGWWPRLREMMFPRKGWRRGFEYMGHRIKRIPDTPHKIGLGAAIGIFVCFSPIFGLHMILAVVLAYVLRGNIVAALITTWFGNPLTFPIIAAISLKFGRFLMGYHTTGTDGITVMRAFENTMRALWGLLKSWLGYGQASTEGLRDFFVDIFLPYALGGLVLGLISATLMYAATRPVISAYQTRRKIRLAAQRRKQQDQRSGADSVR